MGHPCAMLALKFDKANLIPLLPPICKMKCMAAPMMMCIQLEWKLTKLRAF